MTERYQASKDKKEERTASSLVRLTHWYSGASWLWLSIASFNSLLWLEAHVQFSISLLFLAALGFSLLAQEYSLRWFTAWSWFMLCTDLTFTIYQCFAIQLHFDDTNTLFIYSLPITVLLAAAIFKIILDVLIIKKQHELLKIPVQQRLNFSRPALTQLSHELRRFLFLNVLYAGLLASDLLLSRAVLDMGEPRAVADLMLALQVLMPSLVANLVFKVKRTAKLSLVLFLMAGLMDAGRFWWVLARAADPFAVQGILRIVFAWIRICVLTILGMILWRLRKPLVLTMEDEFY